MRLFHVFFGDLTKLPPLLSELRHAPKTNLLHTVLIPGYFRVEGSAVAFSPEVMLHYVPSLIRRITASRNPLLKLARYLEFFFRTLAKAMFAKADAFVGHDLPSAFPLVLAAKARKIPVLFRAHELYSEAGPEMSPARGFWKKVEGYVVRNADAVVVPEAHRGGHLKQTFGMSGDPVIVGNVPPVSETYVRTAVLREKLHGADADIYVVYAGLITPSRSIGELVQAFDTLPDHFHLVLLGDVEQTYREELKNLLDKPALQQRVHFLGHVPYAEVGAYLQSADVGVLLYKNVSLNNYYAAPNKLYEYWFNGLPVVASDFPGLRTEVEEMNAGACCDPASPESISSAIRRAATVTAGTAIRERAISLHSWEREIGKLYAVYAALSEKGNTA